VYQVPQPLVWQFRPDWPLPRAPLVEMPLATGRVQKREARPGEPEHDAYVQEVARWQQEEDAIQTDAAMVLALRDIEYPDLGQPPAFLTGAINGHYPEGEIRRKAFWLRATILSRPANFSKVMEASFAMTYGEGDVQDLKARFRGALPGDATGGVEAVREGDIDHQEQQPLPVEGG
jgi:hypothetical protein